MRIHICGLNSYRGLKLRNRQGGLLLVEEAVCLLHVRRKLLLLVFCRLSETQRSAHQQDEHGNSKLCNHSDHPDSIVGQIIDYEPKKEETAKIAVSLRGSTCPVLEAHAQRKLQVAPADCCRTEGGRVVVG